MTLKKQTPLMTEEELGEYNHHVQNLNLDAADHRMKYRISQTKDGIPYLQAMPYKHPPVWSKHSLPALNAMIYKGLVEVEEATDGHPIIRPKAQSPNLSPRQDTPMAWMTPEEIKEFDQALETVQHHQQRGNCVFDSWRDENTNLYTRTQVTAQAPEDDVSIIADALRIVSTKLHEGSAVRIPMPEGSIMYMARWDLRETAKAT